MCGIAGLLREDERPVGELAIRRMIDVLAHRGPDGEGIHLDGRVGLGHRRLAIIDLAGGVQPMASADGTAWITYNGEVYNYRELRRELESLGFPFRTTSDTEVVVHAYQAWGDEALRRLRGMFAFAIWDSRRQRLLLARDRVGIKPLVYAWDGACLRFASELKAILQDPGVARDIDREALRDYFTFHCVPGPRTIFAAIKKLPPASYLVWSPGAGGPVVRRYWDLRLQPDARRTEADWIAELADRLQEAVRLHMVSDVPLGAFLSGGLDSSTVVAWMAEHSAAPIRTFAIGFEEERFDELHYARLVAARYRTEHVELVVKPDIVGILPDLAWQFDEPFADASAIPTYHVAKITREHVTVALSGDGGDESFAGYRRYAEAMALEAQARRLRPVAPLVRAAAHVVPRGVRGRGFLEFLAMPRLRRYLRMMTFQDDVTLAELLTPQALAGAVSGSAAERFDRLAAESGTDGHLSILQYLDVRQYLPDDILTKVDRTSMLVSLEARVPLLDHVLMEFVATMPEHLKFRSGTGKHVLKSVMERRLPSEILTRPKMGFGVPLERWLRHELADLTHDILLAPRARQRDIVRIPTVERLLERHRGGAADHSAQLWALVSFELWARTWLDR